MAEEATTTETEEVTEEVTDQNGTETAPESDTKDATFTKADLDSRVAAALIAQEKRTKDEAEKQRLQDEQIAAINDGEYKTALGIVQGKLDALEASQGEKDYRIEAQNVLVKLGMSKYAETLIPMTNDITQLLQAAELFKAGMEEGIEEGVTKEVNERLDTGPSRTPANTQKTPDKTPDQMTKEEVIEWARANKLVLRGA